MPLLGFTTTNMQDLFSLTVPFTITYAKSYKLFAPSTVYVHAVLVNSYSDPTGAFTLPAGTILKAVPTSITKSGCGVTVTTRDNKSVAGALVDVTYSTFQ